MQNTTNTKKAKDCSASCTDGTKRKQQKKENTGRNETDESDQMLPSLQMLIKPTAHNVINLVI